MPNEQRAAAVTAPPDAFKRQGGRRWVESIPNIARVCTNNHVEGTAQDGTMRAVRVLTNVAIARGALAHKLYGHPHFLVPAIERNRRYVCYRRRKFDQRDIVGRRKKCPHLG